jgi:hypothetical protein
MYIIIVSMRAAPSALKLLHSGANVRNGSTPAVRSQAGERRLSASQPSSIHPLAHRPHAGRTLADPAPSRSAPNRLEGGLEVIVEQVARLPTRKELWQPWSAGFGAHDHPGSGFFSTEALAPGSQQKRANLRDSAGLPHWWTLVLHQDTSGRRGCADSGRSSNTGFRGSPDVVE